MCYTQGMAQNPELFRVQRINGIPLPLGTMSYENLVDIYTQTKLREHQAHEQGDLVMRYMVAATEPWGDVA